MIELFDWNKPYYPIVIRGRPAACVAIRGRKIDISVRTLGHFSNAPVGSFKKIFLFDYKGAIENDADDAGATQAAEKEITLERRELAAVVEHTAAGSARRRILE